MNIFNLDCRRDLDLFVEPESVDSVVTDPPYELGFMGKRWDNTGVAFDPDTWRQAFRALKPGGHLLAFGGTRTYHRMVCAIEDAGFDIRDQIQWIYGSGFPKASNLKPAHEPICLARKPFKGSAEANMAKWGVGELFVDVCRVGDEVRTATPNSLAPMHGNRFDDPARTEHRERLEEKTYVGRWPANIIHDGSDEVVAAFPAAPGQLADVSTTAPSEKTGRVYGRMKREGEPSADSENTGVVGFKMRPGARRLDAGSAARFFYCAKAGKKERGEGNTHPTVKPIELMRYLCRLVTPTGGVVLDPFMGSGTTGVAAHLEGMRFIGVELSPEYIAIALRRITEVRA